MKNAARFPLTPLVGFAACLCSILMVLVFLYADEIEAWYWENTTTASAGAQLGDEGRWGHVAFVRVADGSLLGRAGVHNGDRPFRIECAPDSDRLCHVSDIISKGRVEFARALAAGIKRGKFRFSVSDGHRRERIITFDVHTPSNLRLDPPVGSVTVLAEHARPAPAPPAGRTDR